MSTGKSVDPAATSVTAPEEEAEKKSAEQPKRGSIPPTRLQRTLSDTPAPARSRLPTLPRATDRASRTMQAVRPGSFGGSSSAPPLPLASTPTPLPVAPRKSTGPSPSGAGSSSVPTANEASRAGVTKTFVGVEPPITKTFVGLEPSPARAERPAPNGGLEKPGSRVAPKPPKPPGERATLPHIDLAPPPLPTQAEAKPARAVVHPPLPRKRLDSIDEGWGFDQAAPAAPPPPKAAAALPIPSPSPAVQEAPKPADQESAIDSIPIDSVPSDSIPIDSVPSEPEPGPAIQEGEPEARDAERVEIPVAIDPPAAPEPVRAHAAPPIKEPPHPPAAPPKHHAPSSVEAAVPAIPSWTPPVEPAPNALQAPSLAEIARTASARTSRPDGPPLSTPPPWANRGNKARVPLAIAGGVALLAIGFFAGRASVDVSPRESETTAAAPPAPTATAAAAPEPTATAAPSPTAQDTSEPSASASSSSKKKKKKKGSSGASAEGEGGETAVAEASPERAEKTTRTEKAESPEPKPEKPVKGTAPFDKGAANAALAAAVASAAGGCKQPGDPSGQAVVSVTFLPSGKATTSKVSGPPFQGTPTGSCIARTLRSAKIPPFTGDPVTVTKTVSIR